MRARKLAALVLVAVVAAVAVRWLFWNDRRDVRQRIDAIAETAAASGRGTPPEQAARAAQLGRYLTDDVIIRTGPAAFVGGRPAVIRLADELTANPRELALSCRDVQVEIIDRATATAFCTLTISHVSQPSSEPVQLQVHGTFSKIGGQWLLKRGEVLRTLETSK